MWLVLPAPALWHHQLYGGHTLPRTLCNVLFSSFKCVEEETDNRLLTGYNKSIVGFQNKSSFTTLFCDNEFVSVSWLQAKLDTYKEKLAKGEKLEKDQKVV